MINKQIIQSIKDKEMDRKDFLKYSGLILLSLVGVRTVVSLLTNHDINKSINSSSKQSTRGFGSGKYGA